MVKCLRIIKLLQSKVFGEKTYCNAQTTTEVKVNIVKVNTAKCKLTKKHLILTSYKQITSNAKK